MEDIHIINLFLERSEDAIRQVEVKYEKFCFKIAWNILYNTEDSEECVNDTWLITWNKIPPKTPTKLSAFLGKITRNLALDNFRKKNASKRADTHMMDICGEVEKLENTIKDYVEEDIKKKEILNILEKFLSDLKAGDRDIFVRRYWYMDNIKDIAKRHGCSETKIKSSLLKKRNVNLKLKLAKIAAAGVVIALLIGGLGHPHEIKAAWEQITSWIQTALGINENVESYIDSVGKTITKNGISITLDEIAADKENLWVAISDNINDSKEKETILLTEVEINGKAAQLDGTYALEKKENGTDGQVCHYRLEDTTIKDNTADIKMKVWLFDPTEMDTADTEDTDDYIFEFSSNWEELEKNTINVNVNKKIKISPNQNLTISKMSLNDLASTIYGNLDNKEYEDYYLIGTDDKGNQGLYRMTNYGDTETVFEESRNNTKYKGISPDAKTVTLELYVNKEEKNRTTYKKYETGTEDTYGEGVGRVYESDEDPLDLYSSVEGKIEIKIR